MNDINYLIKTASGISQISGNAKLTSLRKVTIEGEINDATASEFFKKIYLLNLEDTEKGITVFINSPGGETTAGFRIYDTIQTSKAPITLVCTGKAYSMAAIIFASGNHGRYMLLNSELMLHEPLLAYDTSGNTTHIKEVSDRLIQTKDKTNLLISRHTGKTIEEVTQATSYNHYFSASEAIQFGLCDKIITLDYLLEENE
mgnify:CR=1 FL=1